MTTAFNTEFHVRIWKDDSDAATRSRAFQSAVSELKRISKVVDPNNTQSEVSRLNHSAQRTPIQVSSELLGLLLLGQQMNRQSEGLFGIIIESKGREPKLPAKAGVGSLAVDPATSTVQFNSTDFEIDLLGMAKGYAMQKIAEKLYALNLKSFTIMGGGILAVAGKAFADDHFMCVQHPNLGDRCAYKILVHPAAQIAYLATAEIAPSKSHPRGGLVTLMAEAGASAQAASVASTAMNLSTLLGFLRNSDMPKFRGVYLGTDDNAPLLGTLEPFAKTVPIPAPKS